MTVSWLKMCVCNGEGDQKVHLRLKEIRYLQSMDEEMELKQFD